MQLGEPFVRDLFFTEHLRNDAMHLAAAFQHGVREHAHDALVRTAVDQFEFMVDEDLGQLLRRV